MLRLPFLPRNSPTSLTTSLLNQYQPFSLPTTQSSTKAIPKSITKPVYRTPNAQTPPLAQTKTPTKKGILQQKKLVEFTPILGSYADLLPYPLDNSMVAITPTKVPQPPFL